MRSARPDPKHRSNFTGAESQCAITSRFGAREEDLPQAGYALTLIEEVDALLELSLARNACMSCEPSSWW